jgi:hypothetical protein
MISLCPSWVRGQRGEPRPLKKRTHRADREFRTGILPGDSAFAWVSRGLTLDRVGGGSPFPACRLFPIPRLVVVSARDASKMRKSPQSKKPLRNVFSAPSVCLAGVTRNEGIEANLTILRAVRKMPTIGPTPRQANWVRRESIRGCRSSRSALHSNAEGKGRPCPICLPYHPDMEIGTRTGITS